MKMSTDGCQRRDSDSFRLKHSGAQFVAARLVKWDESRGAVSEAAMRERLEAEGFSVPAAAGYTYPPGTYFPDHTHGIDKKDGVLIGRLRIKAAGKEYFLEPGDVLEIPAGTVHDAEVLGDEAVISLGATR